jgi:hypothetical protein
MHITVAGVLYNYGITRTALGQGLRTAKLIPPRGARSRRQDGEVKVAQPGGGADQLVPGDLVALDGEGEGEQQALLVICTALAASAIHLARRWRPGTGRPYPGHPARPGQVTSAPR